MKIWIVLPAFNEVENLPILFGDIADALTESGPYAVVVVDDGSTDATRAVTEEFAGRRPIQLVTHGRNQGLARTIETGICTALRRAETNDVLVTMDADNTQSPQLIPHMVRQIEQGADIVIASRYAPGGREEGVPIGRRILSHGIAALMRLRFGLRGVRDYSCGYRAYRVGLLQTAFKEYGDRLVEARGFDVMAELLVKLSPFSPRIVEVPLHLRYDLKRGQSKIRVLKTVMGYVRLLATRKPRLT